MIQPNTYLHIETIAYINSTLLWQVHDKYKNLQTWYSITEFIKAFVIWNTAFWNPRTVLIYIGDEGSMIACGGAMSIVIPNIIHIRPFEIAIARY